MPEEPETNRLEMEQIKLERLKVYGKIATVFITVVFGTLGVAIVNSSFQNRQLEQQRLQNEAKLLMQQKKAEADRRQAEMKYLGEFLNFALEDDIYKRLRFAEYFSALTISDDLQNKWHVYYDSLNSALVEAQKREAELVAAQKAGDSKEVEKIEDQLAPLRSRLDRLEKPGTSAQVGSLNIDTFSQEGKEGIRVSNGAVEKVFRKFRRGVYTLGEQPPLTYIKAHKETLRSLGLTDSAIDVMTAVAENAGNLDAINTWDNAFLSFGMFQWTAGTGSNPGELPALLQKIKDSDEPAFQKYFGGHGLDIIDANENSGFFTLDGQKLATSSQKAQLRSPAWAFRFWLSGQDPTIQAIEIQHALSRLEAFYTNDGYKVSDYYVSDLITSEYGVTLILDNYVNRPGYLKPCLEKAMDQTGLSDPPNWGTAEERQLIAAYLKIRETYGRYPMIDAAKRAAVTTKNLDNRIISDERGSFQYSQ